MPFFGGGGGDYHIVATNINGGTDALPAVTGSNNMALGNGAGQFTTTGDSNIFIGNYAGNENVTGSALTVIGQYDSISNITAMDNSVIIGAHLLDFYASASVSQSTVIGANNNLFTPELTTFSASNSVAVLTPLDGSSTFLSTFDLTNSVVIGQSRTYDPGIGGTHVNTVIIGSCASHGLTGSVFVGPGLGVGGIAGAGNNCVVIGADINVTVNNAIIIGDSSHTSVTIGGVTLSSAAGSVFPSAIIGDPGTEGTGIVIGGVTYDALLKVSDISSADIAQSIIHRHSTTWEPIQVFARSNSNGSGHGAVVNSLAISSQYSAGWTGTEYNLFSRIHTEAAPTGTISDASSPGDIVFSTTPDGGTVPVEAVRVKSDGVVVAQKNVTVQGGKPVPYILAQWGIPLGISPSGTMGNNGAITLGTALPTTYSGGVYLYLPANAVFAGSAAGLYWVVMSSTTAGIVYNNTYDPTTNTPPVYLAAPTPFATVGPGAYTGVITEVILTQVTVPANSMGDNGFWRNSYATSINNSAGAKQIRIKDLAQILRSQSQSTSGGFVDEFVFRNRGRAHGQIISVGGGATGSYGPFNSPSGYTFIDTTIDRTIVITGQLTVATDLFILEQSVFELAKGD